jgi:hypothetical protein
VYPGSSVGWVRLGIREWVDDAANFYLNGQEVAHFVGNSYNDFASGAGPNFSPTAPFDRAAAEGFALIKPGTNVFAAELHQASADTSFASPGFPTSRPDMLFAAALEAFIQYGRRVPPIDYAREGNELVLTWVDGDSELQAADAITGPWQTIVTPGQVYREAVIGTSRFFRLREREQ